MIADNCTYSSVHLISKIQSAFIKALQHKFWRSERHQVLQPAKDIEFKKVCLKSCRQEKKSTMHQDSLDPVAIWFMLKCLQEPAIRSGCFLPAFLMFLCSQEPKRVTYYLKVLIVEPNGYCFTISSYSTVVLYTGIIKLWGFLPKNPTYKSAKCLLLNSMAALVKHSQIQKCLQNLCINLLWNF